MSDLTSNQNVWCITDQKINDLQAASIDRLIDRCKAAHFTNIRIRINGQWEDHEADWIKHLRRVTEPTEMAQLMSFYGAATLEDLVARQAHHIEKLQAKLPPAPAMGAERALRAAREERRATEIYYRGFAYNVCSQFGIDSLKAAIRRDGND